LLASLKIGLSNVSVYGIGKDEEGGGSAYFPLAAVATVDKVITVSTGKNKLNFPSSSMDSWPTKRSE